MLVLCTLVCSVGGCAILLCAVLGSDLMCCHAMFCMQLHHALCEMLTDILSPLVRLNQPHGCGGLSTALMTEWYAAVLRLKNDIGQWINKHSKHVVVSTRLSERRSSNNWILWLLHCTN